jgi:3-oxoacyl-[acyl-carrier protein] reductase
MSKRKVALVTGSARGIGRAIAIALSIKDIDIIINYVSRRDAAEEVVNEINQQGNQAIAIRADVANFTDVEVMVSQALQRFGKIDILVNNAGIHRGRVVHKLSPEDWDLVLNSHLKGTFHCCKLIVPSMLNEKWGRIINISSFVGLSGWPGDTAYASAKSGMIGFTKSLAKEVAKYGITVNAVAPGFVETDMTSELTQSNRDLMKTLTPTGRPVLPEEVAQLVVFLATGGDSITGAVIPIDGGITL